MKTITRTFRAALIGGLLMASCLGVAFEKDKPKSTQFSPEQGQEQLTSQQGFQGQLPVVGVVEDRLDSGQADGRIGSASDSGSFASAEDSKAQASFSAASTKIREAKNPLSPFLTLSLLCGVILLATMAIKAYSDKVVPVPDRLKRS